MNLKIKSPQGIESKKKEEKRNFFIFEMNLFFFIHFTIGGKQPNQSTPYYMKWKFRQIRVFYKNRFSFATKEWNKEKREKRETKEK